MNDWSPSGDHIVYSQRGEWTKLDLWGIRVDDGATFPILTTPHNELQARISPDGRWLAYVADDSGALEVYVQRYPELGERYQVSVGGGGQPQWRRDQRELYYIARRSHARGRVDDARIRHPFGSPRRLFRAPVAGGPDGARDYYAAAADGGRFLLDSAFSDGGDGAITVVVNWPAETDAAVVAELTRKSSSARARVSRRPLSRRLRAARPGRATWRLRRCRNACRGAGGVCGGHLKSP